MPSFFTQSESYPLGAVPTGSGVRFSVWSGAAERMWLCLFDEQGEAETARFEMARGEGGVFAVEVPGIGTGTRYGFRADGPYAPEQGLWFDPDKILMDPYALAIDRQYAYDSRLALPRGSAVDTAPLMPKAIVTALAEPVAPEPPIFRPGGLVYEVLPRGFTKLHPEVPEHLRGTLVAIAQPAVIRHLKKLKVSAIELMPIAAWIDERHLPPLGLRNAWGYNPVSFMALDPRVAPGGFQELRDLVAALRREGIGVILDVVFNHTGESDEKGPTLSLRGLDNRAYYRHEPGEPARLVNDTCTGNTLACGQPAVMRLVLDTLRHFVRHAGVGGFRFDLAPVLGRSAAGFAPDAPLLRLIAEDPVLKDRVLIAEPWDPGPGGYQLGRFPPPFLEWNDRFRDDVRRFWRGDDGTVGTLATRLAGSFDIFREASTRTVNFVAAHDGFSLADLVSYASKHNEPNGEMNRDGHSHEIAWNNGIEGGTNNDRIAGERRKDLHALLATLFFSRGTIMLSAGDEFGRTQHGNNNAYAQDNETIWLDWAGRDRELEAFVARLAEIRNALPVLSSCALLTGEAGSPQFPDVEWLKETGAPLTVADWHDPDRRRVTMLLADDDGRRVAVVINGDRRASVMGLPERPGFVWKNLLPDCERHSEKPFLAQGRTVYCLIEEAE
ncbi:glycogen debranching protein GlgX [Pseudaminobacter sp. 19-2017]|uniref:Glycogen debranching protein GlgX n=1 Tax=Pseudaminobacter soli (ex Zhang et al. 2022) TaxID=2831468 RepID=A0A942DZF0_9HYPH|nr:glycogen debranching protein GlgX [Pseudaminobacter soli]